MLRYTVTMVIYQTVSSIDVWASSTDDAVQAVNAYLASFYQVPAQARAVGASLMPGFDQE